MTLADRDRDPSEPGALTLLCERQGLQYESAATIIWRFQHPEGREGVVKSLDFNMADKLLCGAGMWDKWWGELAEYYERVDLSWKACECEGCNTRFQLGVDAIGRHVSQKYCSPQCSRAAYKMRKGRIQHRLPRTRRDEIGRPVGVVERACRNGHERTEANTKFRANGKMECLVCHQESKKRAWRRRQEKRGALVAA